MNNQPESIIKERIEQLKDNSYIPENMLEVLNKLSARLQHDNESLELLEKIQSIWREDLLEPFECVDKLQQTIVQYEDELVSMMDQMDALVKCSVLIKQYSLYLKDEIEKVADKIDRHGLDERIDQLVDLLEDIKPKKHLSLVRETQVLDFPKKN